MSCSNPNCFAHSIGITHEEADYIQSLVFFECRKQIQSESGEVNPSLAINRINQLLATEIQRRAAAFFIGVQFGANVALDEAQKHGLASVQQSREGVSNMTVDKDGNIKPNYS